MFMQFRFSREEVYWTDKILGELDIEPMNNKNYLGASGGYIPLTDKTGRKSFVCLEKVMPMLNFKEEMIFRPYGDNQSMALLQYYMIDYLEYTILSRVESNEEDENYYFVDILDNQGNKVYSDDRTKFSIHNNMQSKSYFRAICSVLFPNEIDKLNKDLKEIERFNTVYMKRKEYGRGNK